MGACTNSCYQDQYNLNGKFAPIANFELLTHAVEAAKELGVNYHVGNILSSDTFYNDDKDIPEAMTSTAPWAKMGVMGVEMEAAGLYMTAARCGCRALAICTVSDHILTGEATSAEERQTTFTDMMTLALETAVRMGNK
jgi:purine-nucleoside phosphorylase